MNRTYVIFIVALLLFSKVLFAQENRIELNGKPVFLSGMNLAWINFAQDLTQFDEEAFGQQIDKLAQQGGNSLRWWLHVNGKHSPQWKSNEIAGITPTELNNLNTALDMAAERNISLILCLWSFDMLQENAGTENLSRNSYLLRNKSAIQTYIDNALIPMLEKVKGHEAIMCWEIFNEPEGMTNEFGWSTSRVNMNNIQEFINLCAGAIHRNAPDEKVSNGSWSFKASSDIWGGKDNQKNYYSDAALLQVGGDTLGFLDFYMVHYYDWGGTGLSPFHHDASYWELDKPIVIAEFSATGPIDGVSTQEAYNYLHKNGYAGALSWTMSNHDGHGGIEEAAPGLKYLYLNHTDDITIPMGDGNQQPIIKSQIPDAYKSLNAGLIVKLQDLNDIFFDYEDSTNLLYTVYAVSNPQMVSASISEKHYLDLDILGTETGYSYIEVLATDAGGKFTNTGFTLTVFDPENENLAYKKPVEASTSEDESKTAKYAVDGNINTRWSSIYEDNQAFIIDLEQEYSIGTLKLSWETAYTKEYNVLCSSDKENWTLAYETSQGTGGNETVEFDAIDARYVKLDLIKRATQWGNSLYEIEIYKKVPLTGIMQSAYANITVFPNPSQGSTTIKVMQSAKPIHSILIYNQQGQMLESLPMNSDNLNQKWNTNMAEKEVYFIQLTFEDGSVHTEKLIVF